MKGIDFHFFSTVLLLLLHLFSCVTVIIVVVDSMKTPILFSLSLFRKHRFHYILQKLAATFALTFVISWYIHQNYSLLKYWNVPSYYHANENEHMTFEDIYYFQIVTWFTIGYGDITPKHPTLKFITVINATLAYIVALL